MPALFDDLGLRFQFPENWSLEEDDTPGRESATVYSPGGGFWTVVLRDTKDSPATLAEEALLAMRQEYPGLDCEAAAESVGGTELVGYDLNFIYMDLISTAMIRAFHTGARSLVVVCQAEDRDFEKLGDVFRAITVSLVAEMGKQGGPESEQAS
jgi:hypothetical protein